MKKLAKKPLLLLVSGIILILLVCFVSIFMGHHRHLNSNIVEGETFDLTKQGAHYVFTANVNGTADATILVESGIPALLADSAYVFDSGILADASIR